MLAPLGFSQDEQDGSDVEDGRVMLRIFFLQDWTMELLTEVHAVDYMQDSMNGIMRVGLLSKSLHRHQSIIV